MGSWLEDSEYITRAKVAESKAEKLKRENAALRGHNKNLQRQIDKLKEDDELAKFLTSGLLRFKKDLRRILRNGTS
jgi:cell division protein FtsB